MFGDQVYVLWSNFHGQRATFRSLEQLSWSAINFPFVGATSMVSDQVSVRWSNFHVRRATLCTMELVSRSVSNFHVHRANPNERSNFQAADYY